MQVSTDDRAIYEFWDGPQRYSRLVIDTRPGGPFVIDSQAQGVPVRDIILAKNGVPISGTTGIISQGGPLLFTPDNTYNIGAAASGRPQRITAAADVVAGNNFFGAGLYGPADLNIGVLNGVAIWQFKAAGHLFAITDNAFDIGQAASNRPRNIYAAGSIYGGGNMQIGGGFVSTSSPAGFTEGNGFSIRLGVGVPAAGLGVNGDYYLRSDTPAVANQRIYVKSGGAWTGIV